MNSLFVYTNLQLKAQIAQVELSQKRVMEEFPGTFNYNLQTGENYDEALNTIVRFENQNGISLQHASFDEYSEAMRRKDVFSLE